MRWQAKRDTALFADDNERSEAAAAGGIGESWKARGRAALVPLQKSGVARRAPTPDHMPQGNYRIYLRLLNKYTGLSSPLQQANR